MPVRTELSTGEREGRSDKDGTNALEAIRKRARVPPVASSNVGRVLARAATAVEDDTDDDEDDDDGKLYASRPMSVGARVSVKRGLRTLNRLAQNSSSA